MVGGKGREEYKKNTHKKGKEEKRGKIEKLERGDGEVKDKRKTKVGRVLYLQLMINCFLLSMYDRWLTQVMRDDEWLQVFWDRWWQEFGGRMTGPLRPRGEENFDLLWRTAPVKTTMLWAFCL